MAQYTEFEAHVIDSLARVETKLDDLTGTDIKKGRVDKVEDKILFITVGLAFLATMILGPKALTVIAGLLH